MDFSYEVSRSLASCEGALLVVDASQGVEAQTLANAYLAISNGLDMIPVINKIDLPSADVVRTQEMIEKTVGLRRDRCDPGEREDRRRTSRRSSKPIVHRLPPPKGDADAPLQALIFDSWFDPYRGVIVLDAHDQRTLRKGDKIRLMSNGKIFDVESMGVLTPKPVEAPGTGRRRGRLLRRHHQERRATRRSATPSPRTGGPPPKRLPGFEDIKPMVFAGLYTVDSHEHTLLRDALEKLRLNDSSFSSSRRALSRWASAFAAAFSACCTWRSSRSGWSANSTWT